MILNFIYSDASTAVSTNYRTREPERLAKPKRRYVTPGWVFAPRARGPPSSDARASPRPKKRAAEVRE